MTIVIGVKKEKNAIASIKNVEETIYENYKGSTFELYDKEEIKSEQDEQCVVIWYEENGESKKAIYPVSTVAYCIPKM